MGGTGIDTAVRIRRLFPGVALMTLGSTVRDEDLYLAIRAGVAAYLTKAVTVDEIARAVRSVARGEYPITQWLRSRPKVASRLVEQFQSLSLEQAPGAPSLDSPLSPRELEILTYIAHGNSNKRIASSLGIKEQSVKNYVTNILRKLAANDRAHAVFIAIKQGWIDLR